MTEVSIHSDPAVADKFSAYPETVRERMNHLRELIIDVARANPEVGKLEETLKWGEPSYIAKHGSTLRMDWKAKSPDRYALYFKCTSKLVPTFQQVYGDLFTYETTRAITFGLHESIPEEEVRKCILATLTYHKVKHLPGLGM